MSSRSVCRYASDGRAPSGFERPTTWARVLEGQSHTSPSQQQHRHYDFFHARLLTLSVHLLHASGNTLASSDGLRVAAGTYLAAEVHLVNSAPAAPPPVLLRMLPTRQSHHIVVLSSFLVQPCLVFLISLFDL